MRQQLRDLRLSLGLTQEAFALRLHKDQHWVSRMERGQRLVLEDVALWVETCGRSLVVAIVPADVAAVMRAVEALAPEDMEHLRDLLPLLPDMPKEAKTALITLASSLRRANTH